jgi:MraZ protein
VYAPDEYARRADELTSGSTGRQRDRRLGRAFFGGAQEADIDRQGRILIPPTLRQWAEISGPVVIIGQGRFLEIWSAPRWEVESPNVDGDFARALEAMERR